MTRLVDSAEIEFAEMVKRHDLTYDYAEGPAYFRGAESMDRIRIARKALPWATARAIWNAEVDSKLVEGCRERFYWLEEEPK